MDNNHKLNDMGNGCICRKYGCKKWKDWFPAVGAEKRCRRCFTLASLFEDESGKIYDYCTNCNAAVV